MKIKGNQEKTLVGVGMARPELALGLAQLSQRTSTGLLRQLETL